MKIQDLLDKMNKLQDELHEVRGQIREYSDGFVYLTKLRCYGSINWDIHYNCFSVQELCDEYYGDNGIVDVYTNNPNHSITSYGEVVVMTTEELKNLKKENVSMSEAIVNRMIDSVIPRKVEVFDKTICSVCGSKLKREGSSLHAWDREYECGHHMYGSIDSDETLVNKECPQLNNIKEKYNLNNVINGNNK
jgi:uncharacterized protein YdcH (DUF465 family)